MEKQRTHLTPEEVQEFMEMGVDFGETACVYAITERYDDGTYLYYFIARCTLNYNEHFDEAEIIPAPNLQEILKVLPAFIGNYDLVLDLRADFILYKDDDDIHLEEFKLRLYEGLQGCVNLLRWVCNNHPETLTKTE